MNPVHGYQSALGDSLGANSMVPVPPQGGGRLRETRNLVVLCRCVVFVVCAPMSFSSSLL